MVRVVLVSTFVVFLTACGGGGDSASPPEVTMRPPPVTCPDGRTVPSGQTCPAPPPEAPQRLPFPLLDVECAGVCEVTSGQFDSEHHYGVPDTQTAADVQRAPVYFSGEYFRVGVDQGNRHLGDLRVAGKRGEFDVRHGRLDDGAGAAAIRDYIGGLGHIYVDDMGEHNEMRRYARGPDVRIVGPANARDANLVASAVRLVNAALPASAKMSIGNPLSDLSLQHTITNVVIPFTGGQIRNYKVSGQELSNTIHIEFVPRSAFGASDAAGQAWVHAEDDGITNSYIQISKSANVYMGDEHRRPVVLLAHEIMHALGFEGHPSSAFDTILEGTRHVYDIVQRGQQQPGSLLYPADREAVRVLYSRLDNVASLPADFGPWSATSTHLHGNGAHASFGVALRNGYAEPYAYGPRPDTESLAGNRSLTGNAVWNGLLLGFTPDAKTVAGDAAIDVDLETLTGRADFRALESWTAGMAPGDAGTGTMWVDGDLGYSIAVHGNTFKQTGGDNGTLTGIFTGASHEGAAGTLERTDLTAAFGGTR